MIGRSLRSNLAWITTKMPRPANPLIARLAIRLNVDILATGLLLAAGSLLASGLSSVAFADSASRPNVLMICVDDLKPTLGCYGDSIAITPHMDRLAARGVVFENAYCNQAVCSPSRNSLMTGLRPQTIGVYDLGTHFRLAAPNAVTVTEHFMEHGYHAAGMGKIYHIGHGNIDDEQSWSVPWWRPNGSNYRLSASLDAHVTDAQGKRRGPPTERADVDDEDYKDGQIAMEAVDRLQQASQNSQQPFFLAVGFQKPHLPFVAPEKYWAIYDSAELPMPTIKTAPKGAPDYAARTGGELRNYSGMNENWPVDESMTRHLIHGYYAATSYVDAQIGRVLDELERLELDDNTIVVLWGDHGWHLGDHGMWCKHTNYEQAARIPLIFAGPQIDLGKPSQAFVETVDIYPTLAELAGLPAPANLDGISFVAAAKDASQPARPYVTHVYPKGGVLGRAIRNSSHRMVEWKQIGAEPGEAEIELYDYVNDALETQNIASEQPEIVAAMRALLNQQAEAKPQFKQAKPSTQSKAAKPKKKIDRAEVFRRRDVNQNGFLDVEEFLLGQPDPEDAPKRFPKFDKDSDGKLTIEEYVRGGK